MRIQKRVMWRKNEDHLVYTSVKEYFASGRSLDDLLYWGDLPKYAKFNRSRDEIAYVIGEMKKINPQGKWLVADNGEVIPILSYRVNRYSREVRTLPDRICSVSFDTPFGSFKLREGVRCDPINGGKIDVPYTPFIQSIVATKNFWVGFQIAYPRVYTKLDGDAFKILHYLKKNFILGQVFFERLRIEMANEKEYNSLMDNLLPLKVARQALEELCLQNDDLKAKGEAAKTIVNASLEIMKLEKGKDSTISSLMPQKQFQQSLPMETVDITKGREDRPVFNPFIANQAVG